MKTLRFLTVLLLLLCLPLCAFAMDSGLVGNAYKWMYDIDAVYVQPGTEVFEGRLEGGFYQYYSDFENNCFYLRLSYREEDPRDNGDADTFILFNIKNDKNKYEFSVDKNGLIKPIASLAVEQYFSPWQYGQELYVGIEFLKKEDKKLNHTVSLSLYVNGYTYHILSEDIELNYADYAANQTAVEPAVTAVTATKQTTTKQTTVKETTSKQTTTKQTTSSKETTVKQTTTKKETTTKFKYTATSTEQSDQLLTDQTAVEQIVTNQAAEKEPTATTEKAVTQQSESTTKFKYSETTTIPTSEKGTNNTVSSNSTKHQNETTKFHYVHEESPIGEAIQSEADQIQSDETDSVEDQSTQEKNVIIIPETENAESSSPQKNLLTAGAIICVVAGVALILRNLPKKKSGAEEQQEEEQ